MAAMFGCVVAGRLVQTNMQQVDGSSFTFNLDRCFEINHLTVFMTGTPFPDGYGASVHIQFPGQADFKPLGILTNQKPSNIYKVKTSCPPGIDPSMANATLGIQISDLGSLETLASSLPGGGGLWTGGGGALVKAGASTDVGRIAEKVAKNLFNYIHSYDSGGVMGPNTPIPLSVFSRWYDGFMSKIRNDNGAGFLEREA